MLTAQNIVILCFILGATCFDFDLKSNATFDEYVEYVDGYINYTTYYVPPTNNSNDFKVNNDSVSSYGTFDFIIVGGGSAGTLMARRLSEITSWKILLLEAGSTENAFTDIPLMNAYTRNSPMNWGYSTVPQSNSCLGKHEWLIRKCVYPVGKVLGGSGVIGDMVYARGNKRDFDAWVKLGNAGWGYDDLLPYMKKTETIQVDDYDVGYHGHDGPILVNHTNPNPLNYEQFQDAAKVLGLEYRDINGEEQLGFSKFQWTIDYNKRLSGGNAFIWPIASTRTNLNVTLNAAVKRILFENNTAVGVEFVKNGTTYNVTASKEVLLSAGTVGSAQILLLSGVGPKEDLENLNITVVQDLPVGKYLSDHPVYVGMYIRTNQTADSINITKNLQGWLNAERPFTTVFCADNIVFINTRTPGEGAPNIELLTINPPLSVPSGAFYNLNENYTTSFADYNTLTDFLVYVAVLHPESKGYVKLNTSDPVDFPLINPAYYTDSNDDDIEVMYEGVQYVLNLTQTAPMQSINATVVATSPSCEYLKETSERDYWYCSIKHLTSTLYHPTGTTRMGLHPSNSVVNGSLSVHNVTNLRVVDAGVIPRIVGGHPLAAIWAIAEKAADIIKGQYNEL